MDKPVAPPLSFATAQPNHATDQANDFQRSLAIIIGINNYANGIPSLTTAANDAERLAQILQTEYGYAVHLLANGAGKAELTQLFQEQLAVEVGAGDRLLVYFAGHGIALDGEDGPEGFLIPSDAHPEERATFLPMTTVYRGLIDLPCRHVLVILDCCFAGAFRWSSTRNATLALPAVLHQERYDRFVRDPAWQVITSAAYDQRALDLLAGAAVGSRGVVSGDAGQHSPFASALFEALRGAADLIPKGQGDGVITASELYLYLRDYVEVNAAERANHYQTPGIWPLRRHGKGEYIFLVPGHMLNLPPAPALTADNNPYCGLEAYDEAQSDLFFGRADLIRQLVTQVAAQSFTVVLGASGTGKSSLVKAGLVSALRKIPDWKILAPMRPSDRPLRVLAERLTSDLGEDTPVLPTAETITECLDRWLTAHPQTHLLLIVDQFEEMITLCRDEQERLRFLTLLANLAQRQNTLLRIVLTLRTDFEPQFADAPLSPIWQSSRFIVTPLTPAELREVTEKPAAARVLFFDPPELVDALIDEVIQTPGALPLLSFTLSELYLKYLRRQEQAQRDGVTVERSLTAVDYQALGGVIGSLRTRANEVYAALDGAQQTTMQRIMLRMVAVDGGELARRRVLWSELEYAIPDENNRVQHVVAHLVDARLLVQGSIDFNNDNVPDRYVEPAHDALVRAWDRLLIWRQQAADYLPLQRRLTQAAQEWSRSHVSDKAGLLWNDDPGLPQVIPEIIQQSGALGFVSSLLGSLRAASQIRKMPAWLNKLEAEFVTASLRYRISIRRRAIRIALLVFVSLLALTIFAFIQRNAAQRQAEVSQSTALSSNARQAIQNKDHDLAIPLALAANQMVDPPDLAVNALAAAAYVPGTQRRFAGHSDEVTGVAFSPDGSLALTGSLDKSAKLWDTKTGNVVHVLDSSQITGVTSVAYSPMGDQALLGLADGRLIVWDVVGGGIAHDFAGPTQGMTQSITALAYSPDGQRALVGDAAGGLRLWDVSTGKIVQSLSGHKEGVATVVIGPDGRTGLSGGRDNLMLLWNLDTGSIIQEFKRHQGDVVLVAYGQFSGTVLSGSLDGNVVVWSIKTGQPLQGFPLSEHTQSIGSIAVASDSSTAISGAWDGSIILWDRPPLGTYIRAFVGHRAPVMSLAYSADGHHVLSGSNDGEVRLWDINGPALLKRVTVERPLVRADSIDPLHNLAIDEPHQRAFSGSTNALVLWDLQTGKEIRQFPAPTNTLSCVALSPDGTTALSAANGDISVWDLATGQELRRLPGHTQEVLNMAYAADGHTALSASKDGLVIRWSLDTGAPIWQHILTPTNPRSRFWSIAFSPDGSRALTGAEDKSVVLWDLTSGQEIRRFDGHHDAVYWVVFSPDGQSGLSASADRQIIRWDLATGKPIRTFQGHTLPIHAVAYSPDGNTILSGGEDNTIRLWDIASGAEIFRFEGHSSTIQNVLYLGQSPRILSRAKDGMLILWQFPPADQKLLHLNLASLQVWAHDNRYVRELTCDERLLYGVQPLC